MDQIIHYEPVDFETCREWLESYRLKDKKNSNNNNNSSYSFTSTSKTQNNTYAATTTSPFANNKDWLRQPVRMSNSNRNRRVSFDSNERSSPDNFSSNSIIAREDTILTPPPPPPKTVIDDGLNEDRARYIDELQKLDDMGFRKEDNDRRLIELLKKHKGVVEPMIDELIKDALIG
jgi:hypothetical protein